MSFDLAKKQLLTRFKDKKHVIQSGDDVIEKERKIVPISPSLDFAIKGIQEGTWTIISGHPKVGKTLLSLQIAANAQEKYNKHVYFLAAEGRIKRRDLKGIHNLKTDEENLTIIQSEENEILLAEDYLDSAIDILKLHPGCVLIIDSASALCSANEFSKDIASNQRADGPKLLASFCRQMAGVVPAQKSIVIIIQHLIANTGTGMGFSEDGGRKIIYQMDNKIRCRGCEKWKDGERHIGNILTWEIAAASLVDFSDDIENARSITTADSYIRFGYGVDEEMELVMVAADLGLIGRGGAWYYPDWLQNKNSIDIARSIAKDLPENPDLETFRKCLKFNGQDKLKAFIKENKKVKEDLYENVKAIL